MSTKSTAKSINLLEKIVEESDYSKSFPISLDKKEKLIEEIYGTNSGGFFDFFSSNKETPLGRR
jgi:hypothetical protein